MTIGIAFCLYKSDTNTKYMQCKAISKRLNLPIIIALLLKEIRRKQKWENTLAHNNTVSKDIKRTRNTYKRVKMHGRVT